MLPKRNVCLLLNSFDQGGAEGQILLLTRLLLEGGRYRPHLACLRRGGVLLDEALRLGVGPIPEFPLTGFYNRNMAVQLRRFAGFLREREVDVIHTDGFYTNIFGLTGAKLAGVRGRVGFRGETAGWRTPAQDMIERLSFRLASVIHANSEAVRQYLLARGVSDRRIRVVYNGVDTERLKPAKPEGPERRAALLESLGLPPDESRRFITIVANMRHEVKDHPMFLRAAQQVRASVPEAAFVLAGEGELIPSLQDMAAKLGLADATFFIGRCDNIPALLSVSDICALSSKAEGFSNSILEYMAAARPVVVTDVGGAREVVQHGASGYLVQSGDHEAMAAHLISLLQNPAEAREMGQRGRQIVEQKFSTAVQLERTQEMYDLTLEVGVGREGLRVEGARRA